MANLLYPLGKKALLDGGIAMLTDTLKVALVDTGVYTYSAAHQFYSSVSSAVVGTPQTLGTKTTTGGVFDAADSVFAATSGNSAEALVIYKDTGTAGTSALIAYIDSATGLPVTPNGGDITIQWNASGIFGI